MKTALLFPGQGSQRVGMGRDLVQQFEPARRVFEEADDVLGYSISNICFEGPQQELARTQNTQPAIVTNSIAVLRTIQAEGDFSFDICAGHSLGEFSALVAAGALQFSDALGLAHTRGKAMQEAVPEGQGGMAALIGIELADAQRLCGAVAESAVCSPANFNGGKQVVISGSMSAIDRAVERAREFGARKAVKLDVSAPFHCALMAPAAEKLKEALDSVEIGQLQVPVVSNVEARENTDSARVKELLYKQVTNTVRWEESVTHLLELGVKRAFELGSGSVLRGLLRRIAKDLPIDTIGEPHEISQAFESSQPN